MAPETFNEQKIENGISGKMADIWSLGVTLYAFIFLVLPFYEKHLMKLINSIKGKRWENTYLFFLIDNLKLEVSNGEENFTRIEEIIDSNSGEKPEETIDIRVDFI